MDNFIPLRIGLLDHLAVGKMSMAEAGLYLLLHLRADWSTGIYHGCALGISHQFGGYEPVKRIQYLLSSLRRKGYINYKKGSGARGGYDILIHKYVPRVGRLSGKRLNAWEHGELARPKYEALDGDSTEARLKLDGNSTEARPSQEVQEVKNSSSARRKPGEMPNGFCVDESHRKLARQFSLDVQAEFEAFRDHHLSRGNRFANWSRAFNSWLRKAQEFRRGNTLPAIVNDPAPPPLIERHRISLGLNPKTGEKV